MAMITIYDEVLVPFISLKKGTYFKSESGSEYKIIEMGKPRVKKIINSKASPQSVYMKNYEDLSVYVGKRVKD